MKVFYDTEFLERGQGFPIYPISIGLVREDGEEYYAVNRNAPWAAIVQHEWLRENVLPHLPGKLGLAGEFSKFDLDLSHPDVKPMHQIALDLEEFLFQAAVADNPEDDEFELWAYYCSYDHVVLAQLFGRMVDMPSWAPYYTHDLKVAQRLLAPGFRFPEQSTSEHHALNDAKWVRDAHNTMWAYIAATRSD